MMLSTDSNDNGKALEAIVKLPDSRFDSRLSQLRHETMRHKIGSGTCSNQIQVHIPHIL